VVNQNDSQLTGKNVSESVGAGGRQIAKVVMMGQGYVGLPLAMRAVEVGFDVVGFELDIVRVGRLLNGDSYVEDVADAKLASANKSGRYLPTAEISECSVFDIAVITVPTPLSDGVPDLSFIEDAARQLAPLVRPGSTIILESTTYPGTTEELLAPILAAGSGLTPGRDFCLGYSPERIDPGNRTWGLRNTPKVISGIDDVSLASVRAFYEALVDRVVPVSNPKVAELVKLLENTFRHVNIALVNELAMFAADLDVDIWEAIDAASTKPFGFMKFMPGPGVGGHCLPVDPSYLSWKVKQTLGASFRFVELANDVNEHMPDYVARRITALLNRDRLAVNGSRILILGLSYKRNSGDAREAPGPLLSDRLVALGADVRAIDPYLSDAQFPSTVIRAQFNAEEIGEADVVVVVTDHDAFDWEMVLHSARQIFDTRHRLPSSSNVEYL
jgi:UDP-N-acetyl-D-mannosaminuronic acid dehydrogenase/UDP-N-acetyl-D-glucosamine dehydrogenase